EFASELNQIIMRALGKNKELRYQGAKDMAQDLEEFLFYVKTIKLRPKLTTREREPKMVAEGTAILPPEQAPAATQNMREIPPTVGLDLSRQKVPTFGAKPEPQKAPRTGIGANYSETAQHVLMRPHHGSTWQDKKVYILGAILTLLAVGGYVAWMFLGPSHKTFTQSLMVTSTPAGAEIWVDGQLLGKTPFEFKEKKNMDLVFKLSGYRDKRVSLSQEAWPLEVNVTLETPTAGGPGQAGPRAIRVESTPAGAEVLLDGQPAGNTPAQITLNDGKKHDLVVRQEGYQEDKRTIDRTAGDTLTVTLQQAAVPGLVRYLFSYPVAVYSGGKVIKGNPLSLPPGTYTLTFRGRSPAYIRYTRTVTVVSGETATVSQPRMGKITVKANPSNCKISIDGEYVDETPIFDLPIQEGSYMVQFNWPALGKKLSKPVAISPDESVSVVGVPE
ncbi:MAG TPA: PEGA domain-containing protein, partial [Acidobacteriota bacterium]|nr:PEGA domain-containing protein [Acidobacteriota bacterium]